MVVKPVEEWRERAQLEEKKRMLKRAKEERRRKSDPLPETSLEMFRKVYGDKTTSVEVKSEKGSARSRRRARMRKAHSQDLHIAEDWQLALRTTVEAAAMGFSPAEVLAASRLIAAKDPLVMRSIG